MLLLSLLLLFLVVPVAVATIVLVLVFAMVASFLVGASRCCCLTEISCCLFLQTGMNDSHKANANRKKRNRIHVDFLPPALGMAVVVIVHLGLLFILILCVFCNFEGFALLIHVLFVFFPLDSWFGTSEPFLHVLHCSSFFLAYAELRVLRFCLLMAFLGREGFRK